MATPNKLRKLTAPAAGTALGLTLRPATSLHWLALEDLDNPLVLSSGRTSTLRDFAVAMVILSTAPEEVSDLAADPAALDKRVRDLLLRPPCEVRAASSQVIRVLADALGVELKAAPPPATPEAGGTEADPKRPRASTATS